MTTALRTRLTLPALAAASSLIAIAAPAHAQSVCTSTTSTTFTCTNGGVAGTVDSTATVGGTQGLVLTDTAALNAALSGTLNSTSAAPTPTLTAIIPTSISLTAGANGALNVNNTGTGPGVLLLSDGAINATLGNLATVNDYALVAQGSSANVTTGSITATALNTADLSLPVGGGTLSAAAGAAVIGVTGDSTVVVNGNVNVAGTADPLIGVVALAPSAAASTTVNGNVNVTSTGSAVGAAAVGSTGASTRVTGTTTVSGVESTGVAAITATGLASVNAGAVSATGADGTGIFAAGPNVSITSGNITVNGVDSYGVQADATGTLTATVGNVSATGAGSTGIELNDATGPITLTAGTISTTGNGATALRVNGGTGNVALTTGAISTNGTTSPAVVASTTTGNLSLTSGTVTTTGATSNGITLNSGSGNLTLNSGKVTATGYGVQARTGGAGTTNLTVAGVQSTGNGIDAATTGTGSLTVTATAPITSTAGYGIRAAGTTGPVTVNTAGATGALGGVYASDSGVGTVNVNATGGLTTTLTGDAVRIETLGTANTTISQGASIGGQMAFDGIDTRGTVANNVTVGGSLGASGTGYAVNATGGATTINVLGTGALVGPVNLTGNADTLTNAGTLTLLGTSNFGAGADLLTNSATGTLNLNSGATVNGLETLNTAGFTNVSGTTTLNGTTVNNSGTVTVTSGPGTLAGLTAFNNTGTINMIDGVANDSLTINAPYNGSGAARLAVDVNGTAADRLIVNGNVTGSTLIDVNLVGPAPVYNSAGVAVVTSTGTVASGAFTLNPADTQVGFLNYGLRQSGGNTLLVNSLDPSVTNVAMLGSLGQELWYQSFDAYHDAIMGRHAGSATSGHPLGIWGQLYESKDRYGNYGRTATIDGTNVTFSDRMRTHRRGAQVGVEFRGTGFVIGATGGYEWARTEEDPIASYMKAEGHNYGAYALIGMQSGLYAGIMVKRDDYHVNFANDARAVTFRNKAHSTGGDLEVGFKSGNTGPIAFDLNAGMSYVKTDIDTWNQYGLNFDWQNNKSWRGRLGARVIFPQALGLFAGAKVFHEFKDDGYLAIRNGTVDVSDIEMPHRGTWVRLEGGLDGSATHGAILTLWGDLGDTKGFGARAGFRF